MPITEELIKKCVGNERRAQFKLYELSFGFLMSVCLRYRKNKDLAQESLNTGFLKVLKGLKSYKTNVPFIAWSKRIMINSIIDEFRKENRQKVNYAFEENGTLENLMHNVDWNAADENFDAEELRSLLFELPDMTRKVFNMFAIDGYNHGEISEMFGISKGTSKWHVNSARRQLQLMVNTKIKSKEIKK
ncbi:MAG: RNA polymerase sigma factor [Flavobacteriales bacterium]|nr:RNA polymerase sigma factor [Flavobacteriales bacterium]